MYTFILIKPGGLAIILQAANDAEAIKKGEVEFGDRLFDVLHEVKLNVNNLVAR